MVARQMRSPAHRACRTVLAAAVLTTGLLWLLPCSEVFLMPSTQSASQTMLRASSSDEAPKEVTALVPVTTENSKTAASVIGGLVGSLLGGVWLGGALFLASSYLSRKKEGDAQVIVDAAGETSLKVLNYVDSVSTKYEITDKLGSAVSDAWSKVEENETKKTAASVFGSIKDAIANLDKEIDFKSTFGSIAASASEIASTATDKVIAWSEENKVVEKVTEKISEVTKKK